MREDLQRRISAAIDSAQGVDGDPGLRELLDADADAAAYAHDLARLGRFLRQWPLPEPDDEAFEALASRIEQRLEDAAGLARIADPTAPPQFDDDDDLRDATAGLLGPVVSSGEFELESLPPPEPVAGERPLSPAIPAPKKPAPPPPAARAPAAPPAPREIPKLAPASDSADERFSFPSLPPPPQAGALQGATLHALPPVQRERRRGLGWVAGLAAAAAVGLGVFATTQMTGRDLESAPSAIGASAAPEAPALAEEVAASAPTAAPAVVAEASAEPVAAERADDEVMQLGAATIGGEGASRGLAREDARMQRPAAAAAPAAARAEPAPADVMDGYAEGARRRARAATSAGPGSGSASGGGGATATGSRGSLASAADVEAEPAPPRPQRTEAAPSPPPASAPAEAVPDEDLPASPERGEVLAAIQAVEPAVRACAADQHGVATVRIVVVGSGRVTTAMVSGQFAGTPVGSCVARAVRTARFPRFSADRFEITYPFQL